mgnify:CR=1 FL=1
MTFVGWRNSGLEFTANDSVTYHYNLVHKLEGARGAEPGLQTGFPRGNENSSTRFPIPEATQSNLERAQSVRLQHRH